MKYLKLLKLALCFLLVNAITAQKGVLNIIPEPASVRLHQGNFTLNEQMQIVCTFLEADQEAKQL